MPVLSGLTARARRETARAVSRWADGDLAPELVKRLGTSCGLLSVDFLYDKGLVDRPFYAHGVERAASLARKLGYPGVTVIEFGVAAGKRRTRRSVTDPPAAAVA